MPAAGHLADHVNYFDLGSSKDWQLMATIRAQDYTFVTNYRSDFLALHEQEPLHPGVIVIVPSVTPLVTPRKRIRRLVFVWICGCNCGCTLCDCVPGHLPAHPLLQGAREA